MRSSTLHALADMATKNAASVSNILRELAILTQEAAKADGMRVEMEGWQREAYRREQQRLEQEAKRLDARNALGDGWHPLKCGGSVLIEKGVPVRLRDGGEHTDERHAATLVQARALGWEWICLRDGDPGMKVGQWTDDGEAAVVICDIPPF